MDLDLQGMPCLEASGFRPSVVSREQGRVGEDALGMAKGNCLPAMQKNRQQVFPHSKIHAISAVWEDPRTARHTRLHPFHQWDPGAVQ